ncbi:PA0069 family radical SAM protein [Sulfidibacter corallicola]|uniref:PA0069 family radical SAM protein n=1 Tax=Sulfidibacter corallicola TaxID=2818388 RepID=A0A8A4TH26_SULCO|nr:PA0069 family radical SAM protein [Sulfidibacter corallicola]QTD49226.1 PA0069 family radical SAM protein [Sulfidibacter corallicola]
MTDLDLKVTRKGRGALTNREGRFEKAQSQAFDDGWGTLEDHLAELPPIKTTVSEDATRSIVTRNQSPDIPFEQSINPYRGCEHGCIYCYARPTHAYWGLSPGLDFETRLFKKTNAAELLEKELRRKSYEPKPITVGANTDPYQPVEREHRVTREVLTVLSRFQHPVALITKSALVLRDLDLLAPMAEKGLAQVFVSVTTLRPELARIMEPRAAAPHRRLETLRALSEAGIPTGVMSAPMIPALNDHELEAILTAGAEAGAAYGGYVFLRLPLELRELFREWLETHFPDRAEHVMSLIKQSRGGKEYQAEFGKRMRGTGHFAHLLSQRFRLVAQKLNLNKSRNKLRTDLFKPPPRAGDQLSLFEEP